MKIHFKDVVMNKITEDDMANMDHYYLYFLLGRMLEVNWISKRIYGEMVVDFKMQKQIRTNRKRRGKGKKWDPKVQVETDLFLIANEFRFNELED